MGDFDAAVAGLSSLASASMSAGETAASQERAYQYSRNLNNQMFRYNQDMMREQAALNAAQQNTILGQSHANSMAMLKSEQDYNTKFAANSALMQANGLRAAGLNPASANGQLVSPGVSGPSPGAPGSNVTSGSTSSGGSVSALNMSSLYSGVVGDAVSAALADSQTKKNLADAGKASSEEDINKTRNKYLDAQLQAEIAKIGLENGLLDYEMQYKAQTLDENIKAVFYANLESRSRTDLNGEKLKTEQAQQKQLLASAQNLQQQTDRIKQLVGAEKAELLSRVASNYADAALAREQINTEKTKQEQNRASAQESRSHANLFDKQAFIAGFEGEVKKELGAKFYEQNEQNKQALDDLAIYWYNYKSEAEIGNKTRGKVQEYLFGSSSTGRRVDKSPHGGQNDPFIEPLH